MDKNKIRVVERRGVNSLKWNGEFISKMGLINEFNNNTLPLWVADMEIAVSPQIEEALVNTAKQGTFGYTTTSGCTEYIDACVGYYKRHYDWEVNPDSIFMSSGTLKAIETVIEIATEEGNGIIIQQPVYTQFKNYILGLNRVVANNELIYRDGKYEIDFEHLEELAKDPNNKVMILCNPHNPIGKVYTEEELKRIGNIVLSNDVIIISDEVHAALTRKGVKHTPIAKLINDNRIITCTDFGKTFNTAGLHAANIVCNNKVFRNKMKLYTGMPSPFAINAVIAAYRDSDEWRENLKDYIEDNLKMIKEFLDKKLPTINFNFPDATYFVWMDFSGYGLSGDEISEIIKDKCNMALEYGKMFGDNCDCHQRMVVASSKEMIQEALNRLYNAFKHLEK